MSGTRPYSGWEFRQRILGPVGAHKITERVQCAPYRDGDGRVPLASARFEDVTPACWLPPKPAPPFGVMPTKYPGKPSEHAPQRLCHGVRCSRNSRRLS